VTTRPFLAALLAGFVGGLAGGLFGVGGGIVLVPMLTAFFGLTQHRAHGTSLGAIGATAVAGLVVYGSHGNVAWIPAAVMCVTSVLTARVGAALADKTSRRGLMLAFGLFLLVVAARILWKAPVGTTAQPLQGAGGAVASLALGAVVGLFSGYLGVGGGMIAVPALTLLFGMTQQKAQGTSLALILVTAPFGALEHDRRGNVARNLLPGLAVGALLGSPASSMLAQRLPQVPLARAFAVFLILNAIRIFVSLRRPVSASPR
jgi:uncharacterized membrane protein YfcA